MASDDGAWLWRETETLIYVKTSSPSSTLTIVNVIINLQP